jgi:hypothetical protein
MFHSLRIGSQSYLHHVLLNIQTQNLPVLLISPLHTSVNAIAIPRSTMIKSLEEGGGARRPVVWGSTLSMRQQIFLASEVSISALGPNHIYNQWVKWELFPFERKAAEVWSRQGEKYVQLNLHGVLNPLTPELSPSAQHWQDFFYWGFCFLNRAFC